MTSASPHQAPAPSAARPALIAAIDALAAANRERPDPQREIELLRLRAQARQALGSRFSMKEFHNAVLRTGSVPLDVLGQAIDDWMAAVK